MFKDITLKYCLSLDLKRTDRFKKNGYKMLLLIRLSIIEVQSCNFHIHVITL